MISGFKSKALKVFWERGDASGIRPEWIGRVRMILDFLDAAEQPSELDLPGLNFHPLKGSARGRYSVLVSRNWRITFAFDGTDAVKIDLEDYHG